jgi:transcription elongation factor Elf1
LQYTGINPGPCPHCGGELEWNTSISSLGKRLETHFFLCSGCDHIHTVEKKPLGSGANNY